MGTQLVDDQSSGSKGRSVHGGSEGIALTINLPLLVCMILSLVVYFVDRQDGLWSRSVSLADVFLRSKNGWDIFDAEQNHERAGVEA